MKPVMIHEDRTECHHEGPLQATIADEDGPRCAAGQRVTHVRFNGNEMTIEEAASAFQGIADNFAKLLNPMITAFAGMAKTIGAMSPTGRILAAASKAYDEEAEREAR